MRSIEVPRVTENTIVHIKCQKRRKTPEDGRYSFAACCDLDLRPPEPSQVISRAIEYSLFHRDCSIRI